MDRTQCGFKLKMKVLSPGLEVPERPTEECAFLSFLQSLSDSIKVPLQVRFFKKFLPILKEGMPSPSALSKHFFMSFHRYSIGGVKQRWSKEDNQLLVWVVGKFMEKRGLLDKFGAPIKSMNDDQWTQISLIFRLQALCVRKQWEALQTDAMRKDPWSREEDILIQEYVDKQLTAHGGETPSGSRFCARTSQSSDDQLLWKRISDAIFEQYGVYRTSRQVRGRWFNHIDKNINKKAWQAAEDALLLSLVNEVGRKWSYISSRIVGRNYNQVKNRYVSLYKKLKKPCDGTNTVASPLADRTPTTAMDDEIAFRQRLRDQYTNGKMSFAQMLLMRQERHDDAASQGSSKDDENSPASGIYLRQKNPHTPDTTNQHHLMSPLQLDSMPVSVASQSRRSAAPTLPKLVRAKRFQQCHMIDSDDCDEKIEHEEHGMDEEDDSIRNYKKGRKNYDDDGEFEDDDDDNDDDKETSSMHRPYGQSGISFQVQCSSVIDVTRWAQEQSIETLRQRAVVRCVPEAKTILKIPLDTIQKQEDVYLEE